MYLRAEPERIQRETVGRCSSLLLLVPCRVSGASSLLLQVVWRSPGNTGLTARPETEPESAPRGSADEVRPEEEAAPPASDDDPDGEQPRVDDHPARRGLRSPAVRGIRRSSADPVRETLQPRL